MELIWLNEIRAPCTLMSFFLDFFKMRNLFGILEVSMNFVFFFGHFNKCSYWHYFSLKRIVEIIVPVNIMLWLLVYINFIFWGHGIFIPTLSHFEKRNHFFSLSFFIYSEKWINKAYSGILNQFCLWNFRNPS